MRIDSPHGRALDLTGGRTRIMGILNVTPDSFSDGGRYLDVEAATRRAREMVAEGAHVLDIGAESTRPGHETVPPDEQLRRILPVLDAVRAEVNVPISVDTTRAAVADAALRAGADWINDTTALTEDPELGPVVADHGCPIVLMHRFSPARTAGDPPSARGTVMTAITRTLAERMRYAMDCGIDESRILLDPGVGFGTLVEDNLVIHAHIRDLRELGRPLVVGPSRKSFLGHVTGCGVDDRLAATAACVTVLAGQGVEIVRVHDVAEMVSVVLTTQAIQNAKQP